MIKPLYITVIISFVLVSTLSAADIICGVAEGFPPYQYREDNQVCGFDADVIKLVFAKMNVSATFYQDNWDKVVGTLLYSDKIDCVTGMGINNTRKKQFLFTIPYHTRKEVIFILADNDSIKTIEDLHHKVVTGDRHSYIEEYLTDLGLRRSIRMPQLKTKEEAVLHLKMRKSDAAVMPLEVGYYLSGKLGVDIKILASPDPGTPVAIAVQQKDQELLHLFNEVLTELISSGQIDSLRQHWFAR